MIQLKFLCDFFMSKIGYYLITFGPHRIDIKFFNLLDNENGLGLLSILDFFLFIFRPRYLLVIKKTKI